MIGLELALAAEEFLGVPFRLHGRDPKTGLDCIGLLVATMRAAGRAAPEVNGYRLRTSRWPMLGEIAESLGFEAVEAPVMPGDVALFYPAASQMHFAIAGTSSGTWIEAHAGLRRVVISSSTLPYAQLWRAIEIER